MEHILPVLLDAHHRVLHLPNEQRSQVTGLAAAPRVESGLVEHYGAVIRDNVSNGRPEGWQVTIHLVQQVGWHGDSLSMWHVACGKCTTEQPAGQTENKMQKQKIGHPRPL
jgi:hypothetical protein